MAEDYLKAVYSASEWGGGGISISGLAARMNVVASTASENVKKLVDAGLLVHVPYQKVTLTPQGQEKALRIVRIHRLLETYLYQRLNYDWDEVHDEAEQLEHVVSDRLINHMDKDLGYPTHDPHGDPIPQPDGTVPSQKWLPLAQLPPGAAARVLRISDKEAELLRHLESLGVVPNAMITMVGHQQYAGTYQIAMNNVTFDLGERAVESIWIAAPQESS